jgi:hypothetical protein
MFARIETQQPVAIAMKDSAGRQHLRIQSRTAAHQTVEDAAVPVGPVHHRGDGKAIISKFQWFILQLLRRRGSVRVPNYTRFLQRSSPEKAAETLRHPAFFSLNFQSWGTPR